ncbi:ATP synthase F1 subunit delta [Ascidiimonas sp. W6]|uniref:ATP synthase F1 subunit delta n=1 Tax=Ascidiimonas meishanensis TaxID=3128903 RepID=UPI0030EF8626
MAGSRAAIRYAKALLSLTQERNLSEKVEKDMHLVFNTIKDNAELQKFLQSPVIKSGIKRSALEEIFTDINPSTQGLFNALIDNKRIKLLGQVAEKFIILYNELKGKETAVVTTAIPLTKELGEKLLAKVKEITGKQVTLENRIDESIIGGFILRVGDLQYNASLASKLGDLKRELTT